MCREQGQQQCGRCAGDVHRPVDPVRQAEDLAERGQDRRLAVVDLFDYSVRRSGRLPPASGGLYRRRHQPRPGPSPRSLAPPRSVQHAVGPRNTPLSSPQSATAHGVHISISSQGAPKSQAATPGEPLKAEAL
jgi:hypothetical protein